MTEPILQAAEAILAAAPSDRPAEFVRSPLEVRVLTALQQCAPLALTPKHVADILGMAPQEITVILRALVMLDVIEHPGDGCYRSRTPDRRTTYMATITVPVPLTALPWPLNDLTRDIVGSVESFELNGPEILEVLLEQCAGLAQAAQMAATQCDWLDHDHQEALRQTLAVLAGYTRLVSALSAALAAQAFTPAQE